MADDGKSLGGLWKNFRENSSAHGIPRTSTATSMVRRVMWSLLFLGACAYFIYNFHDILVKYFSYPVVTNVEIDSKPEIKFPAVAICNLNAVRRSKRNLTDVAPQENRRKKREADTSTSTEVSVATTFSSADGVSGNTEATSGTSTLKEPESTSYYQDDTTTSLTGKTTPLTTTPGGDADNSTEEMKTTSSMFSEPINNVTATTGITDAGMISTEQDTVNTTLGTSGSPPTTTPEQTTVSSNTTTGIVQASPTSTAGRVTEVPFDDVTRMSNFATNKPITGKHHNNGLIIFKHCTTRDHCDVGRTAWHQFATVRYNNAPINNNRVSTDSWNMEHFIHKHSATKHVHRLYCTMEHIGKHSDIKHFHRLYCTMEHISKHSVIKHVHRLYCTMEHIGKHSVIKYVHRLYCTMEHIGKHSVIKHVHRLYFTMEHIDKHILTTAVAETSSKSVKVSDPSSEEPSKWEEATTRQSTRETTEPLSTTTSDYEYYDTEESVPPGEILAVDEESLPLSVSYEKAQNFSALLASLNTTIRNEMGHDKQDFIQECTFNGRICSPEEDFVTILDETYGNCFIFNSGQTRGGAFWTAKQPGPLHGLQLTLFLDPDEYLSDLTPAAGARLLIHEHTQYPFAGEEGISLPPGYTVSIGLSQVSSPGGGHLPTARVHRDHRAEPGKFGGRRASPYRLGTPCPSG
ncbi:degenerin-like protein asic-1 [Branchiostoma lanceolatum]|uniref:degenerin-like protein asic-1 n=1 Tax=Branchiostoma lanceolatum TaxID=7740 RepID=UPI0034572507